VTDWDAQRQTMVETQLIPRGIDAPRVIDAMRKVPRHLFVGAGMETTAYGDHALPIGEGQTISQPYMVALMTQALELTGKEKVLEIGTGSGYQTALLATLAEQVFSVERVESLARRAQKQIEEAGFSNVHHRHGGSSGRAGEPCRTAGRPRHPRDPGREPGLPGTPDRTQVGRRGPRRKRGRLRLRASPRQGGVGRNRTVRVMNRAPTRRARAAASSGRGARL